MSRVVYEILLTSVKAMQAEGRPYREDWQARAAAIDWDALANRGKEATIDALRQCLERDA